MPFADLNPLEWTLYGGIETIAGLILIALLLVFISGPARRKIRWVVLFLAIHVVLLAVRVPFPDDSALPEVLRFLAHFLLLSSLGLGVFLLLTSSRLSRSFLPALPQIFLDIGHSLVYAIAFLIALGSSGVKPTELFAGSALLTAVVGLSLRDTLGNLFAGLAIQAQRPFEIGDWIQFNKETTQIGQVVEINWRATKVVTQDKVEIIVPNGLLAQAPIINYSRPTTTTRRTVYVHVPYEIPPLRVKEIIKAALTDTPGVLTDPSPSINTSGFDDRGVQLCVRFFINDFSKRGRLESAVRDRIWYALVRHDIDIPIPPRAVHVSKAGRGAVSRREEKRVAQQERALGYIDFFDHLPDAIRRRLAGRAQTRLYAENEVIVHQGEKGEELFILLSGEVAVTVAQPGEDPVELSRLKKGNFFGEMAALTGEPRTATVRATRECELLAIGKAALAEVFESSPELAEHVSQTIARRQANLNALLSEHAPSHPQVVAEHSHRLLQRIKEFFSI
ncbi:MAG: mechanosensitive ion channel [Planctomycetes bacterium]|nr:mechanosensitive ion channel [Planctomycetota bacterium]